METRCYLIISFILLFLMQGCVVKQDSDDVPSGAVKVTVIDYSDLDGCTFLLEMENSQKLQPLNLSPEYQVDGKRLYVAYKKAEGMSICMSGTMVQLSFEREIKE